MSDSAKSKINRRKLLVAATTLIAAPAVMRIRALAATQLTIRTSGGAYDEVKRATVYDPFRKETGIEIVPVAATVSRLLAMTKSGNIDIDCFDIGGDTAAQLQIEGALQNID